jgi:hypothetical protein
MHALDVDTLKLREEVFDYARRRMNYEPAPLDAPKSPAELAALVPPTVTEDGIEIHEICDNKSTIQMMKNGSKSERTKHVDVKFVYVKDVLDSGIISLKWIKSLENVADIFTKHLPTSTFQSHRVSLLQGNSG